MHSLVSNFLGVFMPGCSKVDDLYTRNYESMTSLFALRAAVAAEAMLSLLWVYWRWWKLPAARHQTASRPEFWDAVSSRLHGVHGLL